MRGLSRGNVRKNVGILTCSGYDLCHPG